MWLHVGEGQEQAEQEEVPLGGGRGGLTRERTREVPGPEIIGVLILELFWRVSELKT